MFLFVALTLAQAIAVTPVLENNIPIVVHQGRDVSGLPVTGGNVEYTLTINAQGKPTSCQVTSTSWSPALDADTCAAAMKVARYNPARNERGEPVATTISKWKKSDSKKAGNNRYNGSEVAVEFDAGGAVKSCSVRSIALDGGAIIPDSDKCKTQGNAATFAAWLDRPTAGLRSAAIRTVMTSGADDTLPGVTLRRTMAEARYDQNRDGKSVRCEMSVRSRFPGQTEGDVDLCTADGLKPSSSGESSSVAKKRLTIEVVATER